MTNIIIQSILERNYFIYKCTVLILSNMSSELQNAANQFLNDCDTNNTTGISQGLDNMNSIIEQNSYPSQNPVSETNNGGSEQQSDSK